MRRMLAGVTGLVLAVLLSGSAAAVAAPSGTRPVPPAPATAARPPAAKAPAAVPRAASAGRAAAAAAGAAPVFTGYLTCFSGYVYTDFTDPDGDDALLNVQVWALRRSTSTWAATWMMNTGASVHGVFFWLYAPDVNFDTSDVTYYYLRAMDQTGAWSGWTIATGNADGSCQLT